VGLPFLKTQRFLEERCSARKGVVTVTTPCLIVRVEVLLTAHQWSREKISGILYRGEDSMKVSHESPYRHIWADKCAGGKLYIHLRQRGKKRNKRGAATVG
jgi:IS30 family transposase